MESVYAIFLIHDHFENSVLVERACSECLVNEKDQKFITSLLWESNFYKNKRAIDFLMTKMTDKRDLTYQIWMESLQENDFSFAEKTFQALSPDDLDLLRENMKECHKNGIRQYFANNYEFSRLLTIALNVGATKIAKFCIEFKIEDPTFMSVKLNEWFSLAVQTRNLELIVLLLSAIDKKQTSGANFLRKYEAYFTYKELKE